MSMSTFQKVTLAACLVLCVALLLPKLLLSRGRKDAAERPEGSGHFPPMMHRQMTPEGRGQRAAGSGFSRSHNSDSTSRAKGAGTGTGTGGKSNLAGQIIPVYGFGILLYILYILFKITSKGNSKPSARRCLPHRSENMKRKITDFELAQLQDKLRETELVMENIVSGAHHSPDRVTGVTADQEESLLQQLSEITRVMQEGQLVDGILPEKKVQEGWNDYPEEPRPCWDDTQCCCQHSPEEPDADRTEEASDNQAENLLGGFKGQESEATEERVKEEETQHRHNVESAQLDLAGVLQELELTLKVTSALEQEKILELSRPAATETSGGSVRRRNKRRKAKKAAP
ncbi:protein RIC-3b [Poeciliopsis prolifica]|uniref:protein RIC-3b n=1 Tax=Poeciliopsis prolifica TaxID=188132 RepID=UPI0024136BDF|nr:protein RIC-3b [Poeciliopsis prolifica]